MSVHAMAAGEVLAQLDQIDTLIDARSEAEYAHDHLPGACNWPSLNDEERVRVGTLYKQVSPFEARKLGASLVAANIARHIATQVMDRPKHWQPVVYCWRGGQRSGALALVLGQIGFRVRQVDGGYKAMRAALLADTATRTQALRFHMLCGPTGSGKTRLLHALHAAGAQVLDLEALACHRASVLGALPDQPQPSQKRFDTLLWDTLRRFDPARPVFVESESKRIGLLTLPDALVEAMRRSDSVRLALATDERVALLLEDYPFFVQQTELFCERLGRLTAVRGHQTVSHWQSLARQGKVAAVVHALLAEHYDPGYARATLRLFPRSAQAPALPLANRGPAAFAQAAATLRAQTGDAAAAR